MQDFFHPKNVVRHAQQCLVFRTQLGAIRGLDRQDEVGRMASGRKRARTNRGLVDWAPIPEAVLSLGLIYVRSAEIDHGTQACSFSL